jgi:hypothetical protein
LAARRHRGLIVSSCILLMNAEAAS